MRERIAALELANEMSQGILTYYSRALLSTQNEIQEAKRILGNMSIAFSPEEMSADYKTDSFVVPKRSFMRNTGQTDLAIDEAYMQSIPLHVLSSRFQDTDFSDNIHIRVKYKDGSIGYAISNEAFMSTPKDILISKISQEIATQLVNHMRSQ